MASYIAHSQSREVVTIMLSKAEANAVVELVDCALNGEPIRMNGQTMAALKRAVSALAASTNSRARRAGSFDATSL